MSLAEDWYNRAVNRLAASGILVFALTACDTLSSPGYSPAPLAGGESMTFKTQSNAGAAVATVTFEKKGNGFVINASSPAYPPQRVGPALLNGRTPIRAYSLGMLWLPPEVRKVGAKTFLGTVKEEKQFNRRPVLVMSERNGSVIRYFDVNTGFLVYLQTTDIVGGMVARLRQTTIEGLEGGP